jgi:hypothetical protein
MGNPMRRVRSPLVWPRGRAMLDMRGTITNETIARKAIVVMARMVELGRAIRGM